MTYQNQFLSAALTGRNVNSEPLSYMATWSFWFCCNVGSLVLERLTVI